MQACPPAQTASFSRKILALWRISTGKAGWKRIVGDLRGCGCVRAEIQEFPADLLLVRLAPFLQFDAEHRLLVTRSPDADQGGAEDLGMGVEDRLAGDGVRGSPLAVTTRCALRPQNQIRPCSSR